MMKLEFDAIGTKWLIDINQKVSEESSLLGKIKNRIDIFDKDYSRFRADSLVTEMSRKAGEFTLPDDADKMISLYKKMYDVTDGLVTPLIGQVLVDAGYDAEYSLKQKLLTKPKSWDKVLSWQNPMLKLKEPVLLDFGAGGKGYLVDIISELLEENDIKSYCVDAGGDMRHQSENDETLRVGLENPNDTTEVIGVVKVLNQSLCGSAGNRRSWGDFHHIINPETLSSPREISACWVIADTTLLSDLLTTGLFFTSPETLLKHFDFDYFILYPNHSVQKSESFQVEVFTI